MFWPKEVPAVAKAVPAINARIVMEKFMLFGRSPNGPPVCAAPVPVP